GRTDAGVARERQAQRGGVDVDDTALGVVHEHGLAEAEFGGERLAVDAVGHHGALAYDAQFVAVSTAGAAEHPQHVEVSHARIEAPLDDTPRTEASVEACDKSR
ncbi:hypothetical protein STRIP9103_02486, partial [Streptomyces ipomoeae 91-03]